MVDKKNEVQIKETKPGIVGRNRPPCHSGRVWTSLHSRPVNIASTLGATSATADPEVGPVVLPQFPAATDVSVLEVPVVDASRTVGTAAVTMGLVDEIGIASDRYNSLTLSGGGGRL